MKLKEAMYAWNTKTGEVEVGPWPDTTLWSQKYRSTGGACNDDVHEMSPLELSHCVYRDAMKLIIRDGIDPFAVHREFLKIDECQLRRP
jgi:hypothetical protein